MLEIIFLIVFFSSLAGITIIIYQKMPLISEMPDNLPVGFEWKKYFKNIKNYLPFKNFSFEKFAHKILSKIRILFLRAENKVSNLLQYLRERSKNEKNSNNKENSNSIKNDNYWQEVKKFKKKA